MRNSWRLGFSDLALGMGLLLAAASPSPVAGLHIQELALTEGELSWRGPEVWRPGSDVWMRVILGGVERDPEGRVRVRESLALLGPEGEVLLSTGDLLELERAVPAELESVELLSRFTVPDGLGAGTYRTRVECFDEVAGSSALRELPLVVGASGKGLRIVEFLLRGGEGGDSRVILGEARLAGYSTDRDGQYWIEADVALVDRGGQSVFSWDRIVEQRGSSEPVALPLRLSLRLELPGRQQCDSCRLLLRIRDRHSGAEAEKGASWTR